MIELLLYVLLGFAIGQLVRSSEIVGAWHSAWYSYHIRSAQIYEERMTAGWGDGSDSDKSLEHLKKALYHRGKIR